MTFRGRDGHNFHTITAYRPQPNTNPYGVYQQLLQYNNEQSLDEDPITTYDKQLCVFIKSLITKGDQLLLMIDANEDLSNTSSKSFTATMAAMGLNESILSRHPQLSIPATRTPGKNQLTQYSAAHQ